MGKGGAARKSAPARDSVQSWLLQHASPARKADKKFVLKMVAEDGMALEYASATFRQDTGVVIVAMRQNGDALQYASESLQQDKEVVLAAVAQYGRALQYASAPLQQDKEVVLAAVAQDRAALCYVSEALQHHNALWQICTSDLALEASKLRLALASCLLPSQPGNSALGPSVLSRDVVE